MQYLEYTFTMPSSDMQHDALSVMLCDMGFDSFMDDDNTFKAYCPAEQRDDAAVNALLTENFPGVSLLSVEPLPDKDWNEAWEASYQPVVVNDRCRVRAPFHEPDSSFEYDLVTCASFAFLQPPYFNHCDGLRSAAGAVTNSASSGLRLLSDMTICCIICIRADFSVLPHFLSIDTASERAMFSDFCRLARLMSSSLHTILR